MGAGRVFINNMWRAGMRMALRILLIFKKNFFAKKTLNFRFGGKARRYFFRKVYNFFFKKFLLLKSELYSGRRKYKSLEAKMRGANWLDLLWLAKIST